MNFSCGFWDGEEEGGSFSIARLCPDFSSKTINDLPTNGETNSGAAIRSYVMQTLKWQKYLFQIFFAYADAIVGHGKKPILALIRGTDMNCRRPALRLVFDGVANQVLQQADKANRIALNDRQRIMR